jgi:uncharacterized protein YkwD
MLLQIGRLFSIAALLSAACLWAQSPSGDQLTMLTLLNGERQKAGLPALNWDEHLMQSATAHAKRLADHRELSHQFPGEPELGDRVGATGLRFNAAAENVAYAGTLEEAHEGLMHSPPHRANILDPKYNAVGFGIISRDGLVYVAQNFARVVPTYTEDQFREAVTTAFNNLRRSKGLAAIDGIADTRLRKSACSGESDPDGLIKTLPGVTNLVVFTSSVPEKLPANMNTMAGIAAVHRMNLGVCFKPGSAHGYGSFWVVAAFYPNAASGY